jgi:bacteriorhodopsin
LNVQASADPSLWTAYPIVWALSEGTNKISVNTEIIAYGVLDV